jgi:hypothetical protein
MQLINLTGFSKSKICTTVQYLNITDDNRLHVTAETAPLKCAGNEQLIPLYGPRLEEISFLLTKFKGGRLSSSFLLFMGSALTVKVGYIPRPCRERIHDLPYTFLSPA